MKPRFAALVCVVVVASCLIAFARPQAVRESAGSSAAKNLPVLVIQEVETDSPDTYAMMIAQNNKTIKDKLGMDAYLSVALGESAGHDTGKVFAIRTDESFAKIASTIEAGEKELALVRSTANLNAIRKLGTNTSYKAVRFDGRNENWFVYNTEAVVTDEAGYLTALDGLRSLLDAHDFKDVKINCYRVVSGRTDHTHLVSLNCASRDRRAAMMDAISSEAWAQEWIAASAKYRTVVSNGTFRKLPS